MTVEPKDWRVRIEELERRVEDLEDALDEKLHAALRASMAYGGPLRTLGAAREMDQQQPETEVECPNCEVRFYWPPSPKVPPVRSPEPFSSDGLVDLLNANIDNARHDGRHLITLSVDTARALLAALRAPEQPAPVATLLEERYWCGCVRYARWDRCERHGGLDHDAEPRTEFEESGRSTKRHKAVTLSAAPVAPQGSQQPRFAALKHAIVLAISDAHHTAVLGAGGSFGWFERAEEIVEQYVVPLLPRAG